MTSVDMSPEAVGRRLRSLAAASSLQTERRLETKVDMSPEAVTRRLRKQSMLRSACLRFARLRTEPAAAGGADPR